MICDRAADDVEFVPSVGPPVRVESAGVSDQHGASSPMGLHIDAFCQTFSEDDWLGEEDMDDDMEEQGEADVPSTSAQGGPPRSVDTDAIVLQLQAQMAEMARAMATMTAQLTALGVAPQVMEVGTPTTSRDEPVVPPVVVPDPVRVDRVQRTVPAVPPTVTFSTPVQAQSDSIPSAVPPKVESQPLRRPQRQEFSGAPPPPRKADVHNTYEVQDKGKRPMVSSTPQRPPPPPRPQFPPRPQLPPQAPAQSSGQFQPRPPVQQSRPPYRTPEKHQYLQERLNKEYPFKRESVRKIFKFLVKKNILAFPANKRVEEEGQIEHPLYCPFHRHIRHVIEDCYVFKDRVESLMASGEIHLQDSDLVQPRGKVAQIVQMITGSEQYGSQHSSQSSDSGEPLSSGEEWQLALSRKIRGMIRQAVQSSEAVERRPPQAKSTVASTFSLPVSSSPSSVVVPTEHISSSSCIRKMYEREKYVVTSEGKTGSLPALTLKDFVLPPIDDKLMEEDDSGYFWSLSVPSSSRSRTRSFHVLSISDDDVVSLHEEEFECDEPVFTILEGGCYMDSGDESEGTPQPLLVEATQAMTLEPNESPDEFDSVQEIQLRSGKGTMFPLVEVGDGDGRGRSRDSDRPARNFDSRIAPPPNLYPSPLIVESDSDDEMIDIIHHPTPSQSLSFADYSAFPTVRRHLIPEGGLVIDGGSDDDADVGRQNTSRQSFPHPRYGMRVEGSSQQPSPAPPSTSVRGPLYSDSPSVHELHTLYVPPRPGWHASLFHSVGVPQSTDTPGFVESTVDDEITLAPHLSSPFVDSCVERGLVPTTWTEGQARQQARVWRTDLPQTTRGECWSFSFFCPAVANMVKQTLDFWEGSLFTVANMVRWIMSYSHSPLRIWSGEWLLSFSCDPLSRHFDLVRRTLGRPHSLLRILSSECRTFLSFVLRCEYGQVSNESPTFTVSIWSGECWVCLFFFLLYRFDLVRRILGLSFFAPYSLFRSGQVSNESPTFTVSIWSGECRVSFSSFCSAVSIRSGRQLFFLFLGSLFTVSVWSGDPFLVVSCLSSVDTWVSFFSLFLTFPGISREIAVLRMISETEARKKMAGFRSELLACIFPKQSRSLAGIFEVTNSKQPNSLPVLPFPVLFLRSEAPAEDPSYSRQGSSLSQIPAYTLSFPHSQASALLPLAETRPKPPPFPSRRPQPDPNGTSRS
ncbi:hypothetical protein M5K25_004829 [Dendrobium thyrsiflorum]|uniref:Uncharacterized protein n=1 Tax=Dendrobium thyrsiflorum TaxID=117978 RepID=A0ABD0VN05_DENTH